MFREVYRCLEEFIEPHHLPLSTNEGIFCSALIVKIVESTFSVLYLSNPSASINALKSYTQDEVDWSNSSIKLQLGSEFEIAAQTTSF